MNNENLIKASVIFGGGFLVFLLLKPKFGASATTTTTTEKKSFDSAPVTAKDLENADIVAKAYADALKAGEPPSKLTELNTECMKEFGMRCYTDKSGKLIVCDVKGKTIITK